MPSTTSRRASKSSPARGASGCGPHPRTVNLKKASGYWSARVNRPPAVDRQYRAIGVDIPDPNVYGVLWIWIGEHDRYERILSE
jgi:hypothetical protein